MESAAQIWGQEGGCAVPGSRHTLFVLFCISEPLWAEVGPAVSGSSLAFLTPSVHLSCMPLLCAHCPLNVEGQQASRHLLEPPGGALWDPEMLCGEDEPWWLPGPHHGTQGASRFHWVQTWKSPL